MASNDAEQHVAPKLPVASFPMVHQLRQLGERRRYRIDAL